MEASKRVLIAGERWRTQFTTAKSRLEASPIMESNM
jgi:hypothetical protein